MTHPYSCLLALALAAIVSLPANAQEYSNGGKGARGRGPATMSPVEAFGVHPPGLAPADAQHYRPYIPYYAPLSPVASSTRWRPWSYHFLLPWYTPYYMGYSPNRHWNPPPRPYGSDGWGKGPGPDMPLPEDSETTPLDFGPYTSVVEDDTKYWNMGGNGLVPYGADQADAVQSPDLIDAIQASRPRCRVHGHFLHSLVHVTPAIAPPTEAAGQAEENGSSRRRRAKPAEPIPPGEASDEEGDVRGSERSSDTRSKPAKRTPG